MDRISHDAAAREPATVSVLLVAWNAARTIDACLQSLDGVADQVIVVDNASADGTADMVAARFPGVRLIREPENRGFAGGINRGLPACSGELVLLLNCDAIVEQGTVARLAEILRRRSDVGAAGGALIGTDGGLQFHYRPRSFPTFATWVTQLWLIDWCWPRNPVSSRYRRLDLTTTGNEPVEVDQPAAACLMLRRDLLERLGGMDERFHPAWFEDVDLCRRIIASGARIVFVPDARVVHRGGEAMARLGLDRFSRIWYANLQRYVQKHHGGAALFGVKALIITGMLARAGLVLLAGRWRDARTYLLVAVDAVALPL